MEDPLRENTRGDVGRRPRVVNACEAVFLSAAAVLLMAMMLLTSLDVVGRYLFNAPLGFAFELTQLAMAGLVFTALPAVTLRRQHVTTGLFETAFRGTVRRIRDVAISLTIVVGCAWLAWRMSFLAERFMLWGDVTSFLRFPIGIVAWLGVGCLVASALAALGLSIMAFLGWMDEGEA